MHVTSKSDAAMDEADATLFRSGRMAYPAGCRAVAALMTAGAPRLTPPSPSAISLASSASRGAAARGLGVNVPGVPYAPPGHEVHAPRSGVVPIAKRMAAWAGRGRRHPTTTEQAKVSPARAAAAGPTPRMTWTPRDRDGQGLR